MARNWTIVYIVQFDTCSCCKFLYFLHHYPGLHKLHKFALLFCRQTGVFLFVIQEAVGKGTQGQGNAYQHVWLIVYTLFVCSNAVLLWYTWLGQRWAIAAHVSISWLALLHCLRPGGMMGEPCCIVGRPNVLGALEFCGAGPRARRSPAKICNFLGTLGAFSHFLGTLSAFSPLHTCWCQQSTWHVLCDDHVAPHHSCAVASMFYTLHTATAN